MVRTTPAPTASEGACHKWARRDARRCYREISRAVCLAANTRAKQDGVTIARTLPRLRRIPVVAVHSSQASGNCYKVRLLLHQLDVPFRVEEMTVFDRPRRPAEFLAANPNGRIPAVVAYTDVAHEGGFDLEGYPAIRAWLARVAEQPKHIPITDTCGAA